MEPSLAAAAGRLAGLLSLAAFVPYIVTTLQGRTRPNRATWWIWTINGVVLGASYWAAGATHTLWVPVSYVIGPAVTAVLSLKYGEGGWTGFDRVCLTAAGVSLLLWWTFSTPLVALLMTLSVDFSGALPTIRKAWHDPSGEDRLAWALFIAGNAANLFAVERWSLGVAIYPVYMFLASGTIAALVLWPRRRDGQGPPARAAGA